jgi:hypothetical protein
MDPISGSDQLVLLLRQKLLERARTSAPGRTNSKLSAPSSAAIEPNVVQALAALEGADERSLRRALIQFILADQLGASLINDAQFQQVVSRVTDAIEEDPQTADLLSRVVEDLRQA